MISSIQLFLLMATIAAVQVISNLTVCKIGKGLHNWVWMVCTIWKPLYVTPEEATGSTMEGVVNLEVERTWLRCNGFFKGPPPPSCHYPPYLWVLLYSWRGWDLCKSGCVWTCIHEYRHLSSYLGVIFRH